MCSKVSELTTKGYSANGKLVTFNEPLVMAIVNLTPDSFYDGGKYSLAADMLADVSSKVLAGADIIDIGAASSRPYAKEISGEEEIARLRPMLTELRRHFPGVLLSVDTYRSVVAEMAADHGADIINDIGGGTLDQTMFDTVARLNLPYIMMHIQGTPQTMQDNPHYRDVVGEVKSYFRSRAELLREKGFEKIILDPGFGFGKAIPHNYSLLKHLKDFSDLGLPLLAGVSRKGMINKVLGTNPVTALNGTTVLNTIALLNGANILRVHDVTEARQAISLVKTYQTAS